jgi:hypothetical protein
MNGVRDVLDKTDKPPSGERDVYRIIGFWAETGPSTGSSSRMQKKLSL